jgi:hypothetical protein
LRFVIARCLSFGVGCEIEGRVLHLLIIEVYLRTIIMAVWLKRFWVIVVISKSCRPICKMSEGQDGGLGEGRRSCYYYLGLVS